jgi:hypothetical protein
VGYDAETMMTNTFNWIGEVLEWHICRLFHLVCHNQV